MQEFIEGVLGSSVHRKYEPMEAPGVCKTEGKRIACKHHALVNKVFPMGAGEQFSNPVQSGGYRPAGRGWNDPHGSGLELETTVFAAQERLIERLGEIYEHTGLPVPAFPCSVS